MEDWAQVIGFRREGLAKVAAERGLAVGKVVAGPRGQEVGTTFRAGISAEAVPRP